MAEKQPTQRFSLTLSTLSLPLIPVLIPALLHFMLATLALTTAFAGSVVYSHVALLLVTVWAALDRKGWESVAAFIFVLSVSGVTDIIVLGVFFNQFNAAPSERFGAVMIIINLLCKPISLIFSILALYSRRDSFKFSLTKYRSNEYTSSENLEAQPTLTQQQSGGIKSKYNSGERGGGDEEGDGGEGGGDREPQRVMSCSTNFEFLSCCMSVANTLFRILSNVNIQCCFPQDRIRERGDNLNRAKDATANMLAAYATSGKHH